MLKGVNTLNMLNMLKGVNRRVREGRSELMSELMCELMRSSGGNMSKEVGAAIKDGVVYRSVKRDRSKEIGTLF